LEISPLNQSQGYKKLIPLLHVKCLESSDSLTFIVVLLDNNNTYDYIIPGATVKTKNYYFYPGKNTE